MLNTGPAATTEILAHTDFLLKVPSPSSSPVSYTHLSTSYEGRHISIGKELNSVMTVQGLSLIHI